MKGLPFNLQAQSLLGSPSSTTYYWNSVSSNCHSKRKLKEEEGLEPCSVLDNTGSPSPPTSSSSLGGGGGGVAALSSINANNVVAVGAEKKEEWVSDLQPVPPLPPPPPPGGGGNSLEDWESMLNETSHEQTFLKWIMGDDLAGPKYNQPPQFEGFGGFEFHTSLPQSSNTTATTTNPVLLPPVVPASLPVIYQEPVDMGFVAPPNPKRQHMMITNPYEVLPKSPFQSQQAIVDQLFKAAELIEAGNPFSAREILARLNQQLPPSSLGLKPIIRAAFLFKEVLMVLACNPSSIPAPILNPWDVVLKLGSYKAFSEVLPLVHFTNFTCTQTLLEEIGGDARIHIVDFDIGVGGQWSSFMKELTHRSPLAIPFLKITAFVNPSSFHPLELHLTRDSLSHFAQELNIPFEFNFFSIESFDPNEFLAVSANESIAVNLPIGSHYAQSFPTLLRLVKELNPKIVVSVDQGCDRSDLPFSHHFLHSFQACMILLDSIDASGTNADVVDKIERFVVQPRIESLVLSRHCVVEKMPPWRALFTSVGFVPFQFSDFTEMQAECLLKRVQVRGFHVEKRQASLFLYWQRGEIGSVSAWKC